MNKNNSNKENLKQYSKALGPVTSELTFENSQPKQSKSPQRANNEIAQFSKKELSISSSSATNIKNITKDFKKKNYVKNVASTTTDLGQKINKNKVDNKKTFTKDFKNKPKKDFKSGKSLDVKHNIVNVRPVTSNSKNVLHSAKGRFNADLSKKNNPVYTENSPKLFSQDKLNLKKHYGYQQDRFKNGKRRNNKIKILQ